ncbi:MAG: TatD family hydrolase [Bacteroidales bacterium]|nr:TatD family hydrolase [Bacteroidales bacterium]
MKIDIHRHANDAGKADRVVRNLFHYQEDEIVAERYYTIGLHPWHVREESLHKDINKVSQAAKHPQVIAIGEAGLDKTIDISMGLQRNAFRAQIEIAKEVNKPLIIHCVRSYNEIFDLYIKSGHRKPWIIHWFNASDQMGKQLTAKGFYLSFGHMLFKDNSKAFKAFTEIPVSNILLETDDAGCTIDEIYTRAANLLAMSQQDIEKRIEINFENCFGIKP